MDRATFPRAAATVKYFVGLMTIAGLVVLVAIFVGLAVDIAQKKSPTVDEVGHLPAGLVMLKTGTFSVYPHNPPLARILPALATYPSPPALDLTGTYARHFPPNHWGFAFETQARNLETSQSRELYLAAFTRARLVIVLWSAVGLIVLWLWARWWYGPWASWLVASLWVTCPNLLAHAGLVTTDAAATTMAVCASFCLASWLDRPSWPRAIALGFVMGLAQLTKFSLLGYVPWWIVWIIAQIAFQKSVFSRRWVSCTGQLMLAALVTLLEINAGYLGEGSLTRLGQFPFVSETLTRPLGPGETNSDRALTHNAAYREVHTYRVNRFRGTWLGELPVPLPYHYVWGFDQQKFEAEGKYQTYLRGELRREGWWYYYPYTLAIKTPLGTQLLVLLTLVSFPGMTAVVRGRAGLFLMLAIGPAFVLSVSTDINLGLRYVLSSLPMSYLFCGALLANRSRWRLAIAVFALGVNVWSVVRIHPHELAYFNEWVGGPTAGRFHLIDSNLDWGQDLRGLARFLAEEKAAGRPHDYRLAYWGNVPPELEGIVPYRLAPRGPVFDATLLPTMRPEEQLDDPNRFGPWPGRYAVSVNFERGMDFRSPCPLDRLEEIRTLRPSALLGGRTGLQLVNPPDAFRYFQEFSPRIDPRLGYSILLYEITLEEANSVRLREGQPPLPANWQAPPGD